MFFQCTKKSVLVILGEAKSLLLSAQNKTFKSQQVLKQVTFPEEYVSGTTSE